LFDLRTPVELGSANVQPREAINRTEATPLTAEREGARSEELDDLCEYSQRSSDDEKFTAIADWNYYL
jgi:hypothetical protein